MPQKYGYRANQVQSARLFVCQICRAKPTVWTWSDLHGEALCTKCGTPYQLLQYDSDGKLLDVPPIINVRADWVPVLEQYWGERQTFMGLGTFMSGRHYPECVEGQEKFWAWVDVHRDIVPAEEQAN